MYAGNIVEKASAVELFSAPSHPYTKGLLESIPRLETPLKQKLKTIQGVVPDLKDLPEGCRFQNRCPYTDDQCRTSPPQLELVKIEHYAACHRWKELKDAHV